MAYFRKAQTPRLSFCELARRHSRDLRLLRHDTSAVRPHDLLAFSTCRNEFARLPYFLDFYRERGVDHFFFVDNDSNDGTAEFLTAQSDCSVWHTSASYRDSLFGVHWLNFLLAHHGSGHWCLTLDPDEFLVNPHHDTRDLHELSSFLDTAKKESFFSIMLDMYPEGPVEDAHYKPGDNPLEIAPWFDPTGYYQERSPQAGEWWVRGGARRRVFFPDRPWEAPAQNKTVLVKWKPEFVYLSSTHTLKPERLNHPHFEGAIAPTGVLLHFKYLSLLKDKVAEELKRRQHYAGSREYLRYHEMFARKTRLWNPGSARYQSWRQLVDLGLMNTGRWF
jgi:hypothetical protein